MAGSPTQPRRFELTPATVETRTLVLLLCVTLLILFTLLLTMILKLDLVTPDELFSAKIWWDNGMAMVEEMDDLERLAFLIVIVFGPITLWLRGKPRLVITDKVIEKTGAKTDTLFGHALNWTIKRNNIASMVLLGPSAMGREHTKIRILKQDDSMQDIYPFAWCFKGESPALFNLSKLKLISRKRILKHVFHQPVLAALTQSGYEIDENPPNGKTIDDFDLLQSKTTSISVLMIFMMIFYCFATMVAPGEKYVGEYPIVAFAVVALTITLIVTAINLKLKVPTGVTLGLSTVVLVGGFAAAYPMLLHYNQYLVKQQTTLVEYHYKDKFLFESKEPNWPVIDLRFKGRDWWDRNTEAKVITVPIRPSTFGFYQADIRQVQVVYPAKPDSANP